MLPKSRKTTGQEETESLRMNEQLSNDDTGTPKDRKPVSRDDTLMAMDDKQVLIITLIFIISLFFGYFG